MFAFETFLHCANICGRCISHDLIEPCIFSIFTTCPMERMWCLTKSYLSLPTSHGPSDKKKRHVQCCGSGMLLGNMIRDVHPGSGSWFFNHPRLKRHRIPDPDPQHWSCRWRTQYSERLKKEDVLILWKVSRTVQYFSLTFRCPFKTLQLLLCSFQ
jgi:hypothetical protein